MEELLGKYGAVNVLERTHKRFASASYNDKEKKTTSEYLFCVQRGAGLKNDLKTSK